MDEAEKRKLILSFVVTVAVALFCGFVYKTPDTLSCEQLHWVLDGIDIDAMVRHPVRHYQVAG